MTDKQIIETHDASYGAVFKSSEILVDVKSEYQHIQLFKTAQHGCVLFLDGICMLTETTHFVYHEMMVHTSLACVPNPRHVLVIGGGDGGSVSELVKYPNLETITLVELDEAVTEHCVAHMPELTQGLKDPRVSCLFTDGAKYLNESAPLKFDAIIVDSTDVCDENTAEDDIAMPLATPAFYAAALSALSETGVIAQVQGSPHFYGPALKRFWHNSAASWPRFQPLMLPCPFYISGDWCAGLISASGHLDPIHKHKIIGDLKYFNTEVAKGAMALPNFVKAMLPGYLISDYAQIRT